MRGNTGGIIILLVIVAIALFGGAKGNGNRGLISNTNPTPQQKQTNIQSQLNQTEYQVKELKKQVDEETAKKTRSEYYGMVRIYFINRANNVSQEYVAIHADGNIKTPILVTGWTLKSLITNQSVSIPKSTYLYFADTVNPEENIYLSPNDTLNLVTGYSPNGASFKVNKCSGYLNQFQTFTPYLGGYCPAPRDENLSSIPVNASNIACLDYIQSMPSCRIQTDPLPTNWSYECTNFIYNKINYPSCIDTHKNDKDFYQSEWRVYLKRNERLWPNYREDLVLLDNNGKIVDELKY